MIHLCSDTSRLNWRSWPIICSGLRKVSTDWPSYTFAKHPAPSDSFTMTILAHGSNTGTSRPNASSLYRYYTSIYIRTGATSHAYCRPFVHLAHFLRAISWLYRHLELLMCLSAAIHRGVLSTRLTSWGCHSGLMRPISLLRSRMPIPGNVARGVRAIVHLPRAYMDHSVQVWAHEWA